MEQFVLINIGLLWLLTLTSILFTIGLARRLNIQIEGYGVDTLKPGEVAPPFKAETLGGEQVSLDTYLKKKSHLLLVAIAPTCAPCKEKLPSLEALQPQASLSGVEFLLVSLGGRPETQEFVDTLHPSISTIVAPRETNSFIMDYKVRGTPTFYLINKAHKVEASGSLSDGSFEKISRSWGDFEERMDRVIPNPG